MKIAVNGYVKVKSNLEMKVKLDAYEKAKSNAAVIAKHFWSEDDVGGGLVSVGPLASGSR
jgi:hypothetical protein